MKGRSWTIARPSASIRGLWQRRIHRGRALAAGKQFDKALADHDEAIKLDPQSSAAFDSRGDTRCDMKEYDRAVADYERAIRIDPKSVSSYRRRGQALLELKQYARAQADLEQAVRLDPQATRMLAGASATCGRFAASPKRPSRRSVRPCVSIRETVWPFLGERQSGTTEKTTTTPSPISMKRSGSSPGMPMGIALAPGPGSIYMAATRLSPT